MFTRRRNACRKSAKNFPVLYDKRGNVLKEKDSFENVREKLAERLDFVENNNVIRASSNWEYFEDRCSEKTDALLFVRISYKILGNQFRFSQMLIWISVDWQFKTVLSNNN